MTEVMFTGNEVLFFVTAAVLSTVIVMYLKMVKVK